jgi:hypothetical protein
LYFLALSFYSRIPEPYSMGQTHRRLARLASSPEARRQHVLATRDAWQSIDRPDLIDELRQEFEADF